MIVLLYRLRDLSPVQRWAARVESTAPFVDVVLFAYAAKHRALAAGIWSIAEEATASEPNEELLTIASEVSEAAREVLGEPTDALSYGFHASATLEQVETILGAAGFAVVRDVTIDPRGFSAAIALLELNDRLSSLDAPSLRDAIEKTLLEIPELLFRSPALRRAFDDALLDERTRKALSARSLLHALRGLGPERASDLVQALSARSYAAEAVEAEPEDIGAAIETLQRFTPSPAVIGLPSTSGRGKLPRIRDLVASRDGKRLLVAADDVRLILRADSGEVIRGEVGRGENAAGVVRLRAPGGELRTLPARARDDEDAILSADFDVSGRIVSGRRHGEVRLGADDVDASKHTLVARFDAPVFRVRTAPVGRSMALVVGTSLVVIDPMTAPRTLGPASTGADLGTTHDYSTLWYSEGAKSYVAWAGDAKSLAVCVDGELVIYATSGEVLRRKHIAGPFEAHGEVGWSALAGFIVPRYDGLALLENDGKHRVIKRASPAREGSYPGRITVSADGRVALVHYTWDAGLNDASTIEVFDLLGDKAYVLKSFAQQLDFSPIALAPSGDAVAFGFGDTLWVEPWSVRVRRDDAYDHVALARALVKANKPAEALVSLDTMPSTRGRTQLDNAAEAARREAKDAVAAAKRAAAATLATKPMPVRPKTRLAKSQLEEGREVTHAKFGTGTILEVDGDGAEALVTVEFSGVERRLKAQTLTLI
jgi:hypothetical protein